MADSQQRSTDNLPLPPEYEHAHISTSHVEAELITTLANLSTISLGDESSFFSELVRACEGTWDLPFVHPLRYVWQREHDQEGESSESAGGSDESSQEDSDVVSGVKVPLYVVESEDGRLLETSLNSLGGASLSIRKLLDMDEYYLQAQLRQEYANILRTRSVNRDQMSRIRNLLAYWRDLHKVSLEPDDEEESLLRMRLELGKLAKKDKTGEAEEHEKPKRRLTVDTLKEVEQSKPVRRFEAVVRFFHLDNAMGPDTAHSYLDYKTRMRRVERFERKRIRFSRRLVTALIGGLVLAVPVLIMALRPSLNKSLITTCAAVTIFSLYLALATSSLNQTELLGASAAYAAVLAVFVGIGLSPNSAS